MDTGICNLFQLRILERSELGGDEREREIKGSQQSEAHFLFLVCHEWAVQVFVYPGTQGLLKEWETEKKISLMEILPSLLLLITWGCERKQ